MSNIPQSAEKRKKFFKLVEQGVTVKNAMDLDKEELANLGEISKEEFEVSKSDYNKYVNALCDMNKANDKLNEIQTVLTDIEIMKG